MRITRALPSSIFLGTAALVATSLVMSIYQSREQSPEPQMKMLTYYSNFLGIIGVSSLAQVMAIECYQAFCTNSNESLPVEIWDDNRFDYAHSSFVCCLLSQCQWAVRICQFKLEFEEMRKLHA